MDGYFFVVWNAIEELLKDPKIDCTYLGLCQSGHMKMPTAHAKLLHPLSAALAIDTPMVWEKSLN